MRIILLCFIISLSSSLSFEQSISSASHLNKDMAKPCVTISSAVTYANCSCARFLPPLYSMSTRSIAEAPPELQQKLQDAGYETIDDIKEAGVLQVIQGEPFLHWSITQCSHRSLAIYWLAMHTHVFLLLTRFTSIIFRGDYHVVTCPRRWDDNTGLISAYAQQHLHSINKKDKSMRHNQHKIDS